MGVTVGGACRGPVRGAVTVGGAGQHHHPARLVVEVHDLAHLIAAALKREIEYLELDALLRVHRPE